MIVSPLRRPRRLPLWAIGLGTLVWAALNWMPWHEPVPGVTDWGHGPASPAAEVSWNEEVALHFTGRSLWILQSLEPSEDRVAGWPARLLAWWWRGVWTSYSAEEQLLGLLDEAVEHGLTTSGLAAAAAGAHLLGDDRRASEWLGLALGHQPEPAAGSDLALARLWLAGRPGFGTAAAADPGGTDDELARQLERLPSPSTGEAPRTAWWRLAALEELTAGQTGSGEAAVAAMLDEGTAHWRARLALFGLLDAVLLLSGLLLLPLVWRVWAGRGRPPQVDARAQRRFLHSRVVDAWGVAGMWGWFVWISLMALAVSLLAAGLGLLPAESATAWILLWQVATLLLTLWAFRLANGPGLRLVGLWPPPGVRRGGLVRGAAMVLSGWLVLMLLHLGHAAVDPSITLAKLHDIYHDEAMIHGAGGLGLPLADLLSAVVLAAVMEEVLHRGIIYRVLRQRFGLVAGLLASSALFSVLHFYSMFGLVSVFLSGLVFAWVYERTRSLWPPILLHALLNWTITTQMWVLWGAGDL